MSGPRDHEEVFYSHRQPHSVDSVSSRRIHSRGFTENRVDLSQRQKRWRVAAGHRRSSSEDGEGTEYDIAYVDNVPDNASMIKPAVELFIQRGYNIVLGSSFGYSDTFKELAAEHPKVAFIDIAGIQ